MHMIILAYRPTSTLDETLKNVFELPGEGVGGLNPPTVFSTP